MATAALLALAAVVYQPWRFEPIEVMDFSEFLPLLRDGKDFGAGLANLVRYYAGQGRINVVIYALLSSTYQWAHLDALGWHLSRFVQMSAVVVGVYLVLRRMNGSVVGSVMGASLFVVASVAAGAWLRHAAEPVGTLFFLFAIVLAIGYHDARRWRARAAGIGIAVLGMLLCKETFVACVPFVVGLALVGDLESRTPGSWKRRATVLLVAVLTAILAVAGALLLVKGMLRSDAYARLYGTGIVSAQMLLERLLLALLPAWSRPERPLLFALTPPNLVFLVLWGFGAGSLAFAAVDRRRRSLQVLALCGVLLLSGVLIYLPWPRFEPFYGLPFLVAPALTTTILFDALQSNRVRAGWVTAWVALSAAAGLAAFGMSRAVEARRIVNAELTQWLSMQAEVDSVFMMSNNVTPQTWQNPGVTMARYAMAVGLTPKPVSVVDVLCADAPRLLRDHPPPAPVIYDADSCGPSESSGLRLQQPFSYFDWQALAIRTGFRRVNIILSQRSGARE